MKINIEVSYDLIKVVLSMYVFEGVIRMDEVIDDEKMKWILEEYFEFENKKMVDNNISLCGYENVNKFIDDKIRESN